jgi:hypothetical protein
MIVAFRPELVSINSKEMLHSAAHSHSQRSLLMVVLFCCVLIIQGSGVSPLSTEQNPDQDRRKAAAIWFREAGDKARSVVDTLKLVASFSLPFGSEDSSADSGETESLLESVTRGVQGFASPQVVGLPTVAKRDPKKSTLPIPRGGAHQQRRTRLTTGGLAGAKPNAASTASPSRKQLRRQFGSLASSTPIADAHSSIFTSADQIISIIPTATTSVFCSDGAVGVELSTSTLFTCTDAAGVNTTRDAFYFKSASKAERANCTYVEGTSPKGKQCLCSSDYMLFRTRPTFFGCLPRNFTCSTTLLGLNSCRLPGYAEPEPDMDSCYSLSRSPSGPNGNGNAARGSWRLSIQCSIESYINPAIYEPLGAVQATPANASAVWVPIDTAVDDGSSEQPSGTFDELSTNLYLFPAAFDVLVGEQNSSVAQASQPPSGSSRLHLTMRHPLVTYGTLEIQFFDFNEPSRTDGGARVVLPLAVDNASSASGMGAGTLHDPTTGSTIAALSLLATPSRVWNISYDISTLPDHYFYGGRLYMEVGLLSAFGLVSRYSVAGLQIEILDTVTPTQILTYSNKLSTSTVAIIAVAVACAVFIVLVVAWKLWRLPPEEDVSVVGGRIRRAESISNNMKKDMKKK